MKIAAGLLALSLLSGCAWMQAHISQIALVGTVAGTVAAVEGAALNAKHLYDEFATTEEKK